MKLEAIDTNFTEVLDGVAFSMGCRGARVIVIVANETLVRMGLPENELRHPAFMLDNLKLWQKVACEKFAAGEFENRGSRVRILPRDMEAQDFKKAS